MILVVRHASAGQRSSGQEDRSRPLDGRGRRQAEALAVKLAKERPHRVASSPYTRCRQTVEPLARRLGLKVEIDQDLAEGGNAARFLERPSEFEGGVYCTHGDVMWELLLRLREAGLIPPSEDRGQKGSVWRISVERGRVTAATYLAPPKVD